MKDKLTKKTDTKFDSFCNKIKKVSLSFLCLSFISFVPINLVLDSREQTIVTEIVALKAEQDELLMAHDTSIAHNARSRHALILKK